MNERTTFEADLADAFERYLAGAPVEVDPARVAAVVASGSARRRFGPLAAPRGRSWALSFTLVLLALALLATTLLYVGRDGDPLPRAHPYRGVFVLVGQMRETRQTPVMVTLADGRVLIAASEVRTRSDVGPPAEVFDPATGTSIPIRGDTPSGAGSGILLRDGRVLTITFDSNYTASYAYIFDPASSTFRRLPQPGYSNAPPFGVEPSMTRLDDGRVLVSGGLADVYEHDMLASAMIFDPETEVFSPTGPMHEARRWHALTTLADGRVLAVGGESKDPTASNDGVGSDLQGRTYLASVEIYDPQAGTFAMLPTRSAIPGATLGTSLPDRRVLIAPAGGIRDEIWLEAGLPARSDHANPPRLELFDPSTDKLSAGPILPGLVATATATRDGRVLLTGTRPSEATTSAWAWEPWSAFYDPADGTLVSGPVPDERLAAAALLHDGRVLFAGGITSAGSINVGDATVSSRLVAFE